MSLQAFFTFPGFAGISSATVCADTDVDAALEAVVVVVVGVLVADDVVEVVSVGVRGATVLRRLITSFKSSF